MSSWLDSESHMVPPGCALAVGEIRTGLLFNSVAIPQNALAKALRLVLGERVRTSYRPIGHGVSADVLTGVDCTLTAASGATTRAVGTVAARATITGGRVVQGSARALLVESEVGYRRPWSHFLASPGTVETIGKVDWVDLARSLETEPRLALGLDLGAICDRVLDSVQQWPELDRNPPFKTVRTRLRWVVQNSGNMGDDHLSFILVNSELRTLSLVLTEHSIPAVLELCEDLALHDWLLTTLLDLIERSQMGSGELSHTITKLRPAVDHLLHLWMPGARVDLRLMPLWRSLDNRPGFTPQWEASVSRIRDQLALNTLTLLSAVAEDEAGAREQRIKW